MPGRTRTALCAAALLCCGCLSAPSETGGECGTAAALRDDFDGEGGAPPQWYAIYLPEYFERSGGRLRFVAPAEDVTVVLRSRSAFRVADGEAVRVDVATWPASLDAYVMLDGLTHDFIFHTNGTALDAIAPLGSTAQTPLEGVRAVRFLREEDRVTMQWSSDGDAWNDLLFEPWTDELTTLRIMTLARAAVSGEVLELESVNGDVDRASWCSVGELTETFDGPTPDLFDPDGGGCEQVGDGQLNLGGSCATSTARAYSFEGAAIEVRMGEDADAASELTLRAFLADGSARTLVWTPSGARYEAPGGILGSRDGASTRMRLVHGGGALAAQLWLNDAWEDLGADPLDDELLRDVSLRFSAGPQPIFIEELRGSSD